MPLLFGGGVLRYSVPKCPFLNNGGVVFTAYAFLFFSFSYALLD